MVQLLRSPPTFFWLPQNTSLSLCLAISIFPAPVLCPDCCLEATENFANDLAMPGMLTLVVRDGNQEQVACHALLLQHVTLSSWVCWSYCTLASPSSFPLWFSPNWIKALGELPYYASYGLVLQGEPRQGYGQAGPTQSSSDMVCTALESRPHTFLGPVQTSP